MVGNFEGTVGFDEKTVTFINAVNHIKKQRGLLLKEIASQIGLDEDRHNMIRAKRSRATIEEIQSLLKTYPEALNFFSKFNFITGNTTLEQIENPPVTQKLNEPMGTHFYGKKPEPWPELVDTQKKLIEKLEAELVEVKERLKVVEAERKTLIDIVSQRK